MKKLKIIIASLITTMMSASAYSGLIEVNSVVGLTNALATAREGADIVLLKSGSPYVFGEEFTSESGVLDLLEVKAGSLTIRGEDDSPRANWIAGAEPVIIDGNGRGRIFNFASGVTGVSVRNLTLTGGNAGTTEKGGAAYASSVSAVTFSNCVFRQNTAQYQAAAYSVTIRDCLVTNCTSTARNAFLGTAYGSDFIDNAPGAADKISAYDCRFIGNFRSSGGAACASPVILSNCVFTANSGYCIIDSANTSKYLDCVFTNNVSSNRGVLWGGGEIRGCIFADNSFSNGSVTDWGCGAAVQMADKASSAIVADCSFIRNHAYINKSGGAIFIRAYANKPVSVAFTNCVFEGNQGGTQYPAPGGGAIMNFNDEFTDAESIRDRVTVYDSTFRTNVALNAGGVSLIKAVNCRFFGNSKVNLGTSSYHGCDAVSSYLEGCEINGGELMNCVLDRCDIHDVTVPKHGIFREYTRVTNSIVRNCGTADSKQFLYFANETLDAEFVNCTFVTNQMRTYVCYASITETNAVRFVNCLFHGNRVGDAITDFAATSTLGSPLWSEFVFHNTYYGAFKESAPLTDEWFSEKTSTENGLMLCAEPLFAGKDSRVMQRYPDEPYWALSYRSPLVGKGDASVWTNMSLDLHGRLRVRDGKTDVGCYQCWLNPPGMKVILK